MSIQTNTNSMFYSMQGDGIYPVQQIIADGLFHRVDDANGKPHNKLIGYVCFGDAGYYCHWSKMPEGRNWSIKRETDFTPEERKQYAIQMQQAKQERVRAESQRHAECRERSKIVWNNAPLATDDHPYLIKKGVLAHGTKLDVHNRLIVPVYDVNDVLHGLQYISADGSKKFESGTAVQGHFSYLIGDSSKPYYLCEGFATAATIHELTGATVFIAFNCNNLKPVAEAIWSQIGGAE